MEAEKVQPKHVQASEKYIGQLWRLPNGQLVLVEDAKHDLVAGRRINGDQANTIVVCKVSELQPK